MERVALELREEYTFEGNIEMVSGRRRRGLQGQSRAKDGGFGEPSGHGCLAFQSSPIDSEHLKAGKSSIC